MKSDEYSQGFCEAVVHMVKSLGKAGLIPPDDRSQKLMIEGMLIGARDTIGVVLKIPADA